MEHYADDRPTIPPLAGVCTYDQAYRTGYDVKHTVELLRRYNYVTSRLNEIFAAHLTHTPEWEAKCAFSLHLWLDAEHSAVLRKRVSEMRQPPPRMDEVPDRALQAWLDEVIRAEYT